MAVGLEVGKPDQSRESWGRSGLGIAGEPESDVAELGHFRQARGDLWNTPGSGVGVEGRPGATAGDGGPLADVLGVVKVAADVDAEGIDSPTVDLGGEAEDEVIGLGNGQVLCQAGLHDLGLEPAGFCVAHSGAEVGKAGAGVARRDGPGVDPLPQLAVAAGQ